MSKHLQSIFASVSLLCCRHNIEHAQHHDVYRTPDTDLTMVQPITLIKPKPTKELTDLEADLFARGRAYFCDF